ncbi:class I SAM-dependent methyltransferase [bacterium]|nr:MAG: class I SAM-dependent methyltransferase [bacterium]
MSDGFFKWSDEQINELHTTVLDPGFWWSRRFEYPWALSALSSKDVILDAACGTYHPFKFSAGGICKVHACDVDSVLPDERYEFTHASITALPYQDKTFTKVFCISVLEHLVLSDITQAAKEFKRVLKPNGKLYLTVDYPTCDLPGLYQVLKDAGFKVGAIGEDMEGAVSSTYFGRELYCYHLVATA